MPLNKKGKKTKKAMVKQYGKKKGNAVFYAMENSGKIKVSKRKLPEINKKIFPYDLVITWWEDIVADSIWVDIPDIKKSTTAICCTVGWLMKQDDKVTILMSDFNFESNNEVKQGGGHTTIPTKNILKIKKIKI